MDYGKLMTEARKTNARRDKDEREVGFQAASDADPALLLRTAMSAIECGISTEDWKAVAEGQAMLELLHLRVYAMETTLMSVRLGAGGCVSYESNLLDQMRDWSTHEYLGKLSTEERDAWLQDKDHLWWAEPYASVADAGAVDDA